MNSKYNLTRNLFKKILIFLLVVLNFRFASADEYLSATVIGNGHSETSLLVQTMDGKIFFSEIGKPYNFQSNCGCTIYVDDTGNFTLILPDGTNAKATKKFENEQTILEFVRQSNNESNENSKKPRKILSSKHEEKILRELGYSPKKLDRGGKSRIYKDASIKKAIKFTSLISESECKNAEALKQIPALQSLVVIPEPKARIGSSDIFEMPLCECDGTHYIYQTIHRADKTFCLMYQLERLENLLSITQKIAAKSLTFFDAAHSNNLVHLDFKLENILVDSVGQEPRFRISDFETMVDCTGKFGGNRCQTDTTTPIYADYQNLERNTITSLKYADMYSLGASLYDHFSQIVNCPSSLPKIGRSDLMSKETVSDFQAILRSISENYLELIWNTVYCGDEEISQDHILQILNGAPVTDYRDTVAIHLYCFLNFVTRLTTSNMNERLTAEQALNHPFLNIKF